MQKVPGRNEYLVARHADISEVMRRPDEVFSNLVFIIEDGEVRRRHAGGRPCRSRWPDLLLRPPGSHQKRRIAFEYVKPGRLAGHERLIATIVDELIDGFAPQGTVEFVSAFAVPLPTRVIIGILGFPEADAARALGWGNYDGHGNRYLPADRRQDLE